MHISDFVSPGLRSLVQLGLNNMDDIINIFINIFSYRNENDKLEKETIILTKYLKRVDPKDIQTQIKGDILKQLESI